MKNSTVNSAFLLIILLFCLCQGCTTNPGWVAQESGITSSLMGVWFTDANKGFCVGEEGTILRTTDGGISWVFQKSGIITAIWDVFFINADTGTAVGGWSIYSWSPPFFGGYILRNTNGGTTWAIQKHDTTIIGFYAVYYSDKNTGTVVGAGGTILHTTDGGDTWTEQISGTTSNLMDVCFADNDTGIIVGDNFADISLGGTILRTENGGKSWIKQDIPTENALGDVFFIDANTGTAVGSNGTILHTTTGGEPW